MTLETARIRQTAGAAAFGGLTATGTNEKEPSGDFAALLMNLMDQRPAPVEQPRFKTMVQRSSPIMRREKPESPPRAEPARRNIAEKATSAQVRQAEQKTATERPAETDETAPAQKADTPTESQPTSEKAETASEAAVTGTESLSELEATETALIDLPEELQEEILDILKEDENLQNLLAGLQPQEAKQVLQDLVKAAMKAIQEAARESDDGGMATIQKLQSLFESLKSSPELSKLGIELDQKVAQKLFEKLLEKAELKASQGVEVSTEALKTEETPDEQTDQPQGNQEKSGESQNRRSETASALNPETEDSTSAAAGEAPAKTAPDALLNKVRGSEESLRAKYESRHGEEVPTNSLKANAQATTATGPIKGGEVPVVDPGQVLKEYAQWESRLGRSVEGAQTEEVPLKSVGQRKGFSHQQSESGNQGSSAFSRGLKADVQTGRATPGEGLKNTVFNQLIEKAMLNRTPEAVKTLTIQLKPEFLGKVDMELKTKDGVVTARLMAENPVVRDTIESLIPQIREHLAEQGINLQQFTVDVYSQQSRGDPSGQGSGKNSRGSSSSQAKDLLGASQGSEAGSSEKPLTNANGMIDITV